jgi:hypothetical protein
MQIIYKELEKMNNLQLIDEAQKFNWELRSNRKEIIAGNHQQWMDAAYWLISVLIDKFEELDKEHYEMQTSINNQVSQAIHLASIKSQGNS